MKPRIQVQYADAACRDRNHHERIVDLGASIDMAIGVLETVRLE